MRNLVFVAVVFLLAPVVASFVDGEGERTSYWTNGRVRSVVTVRRSMTGELVREGPCRFMREGEWNLYTDSEEPEFRSTIFKNDEPAGGS